MWIAVYWCVLQCIADVLRCIRLIPSPGPPGRAAGLLAAGRARAARYRLIVDLSSGERHWVRAGASLGVRHPALFVDRNHRPDVTPGRVPVWGQAARPAQKHVGRRLRLDLGET